jgi:HSP20 family protein
MTKEEESGAEVSFDMGLGGLFKGLGNLVDLLGEVAETGEEIRRSGEFKIKGLDEKARGVYGVTIRSGIGGAPHVDHFGNIRSTEEGPEVAEAREPLVDVFDEEGEILVVIELPGVSEGEIEIDVQDDILSLETTGEHRYAKELLLPAAVDRTTLKQTYKNGILELRLKKAA